MSTKIKRLFTTLVLLSVVFLLLATPTAVYADIHLTVIVRDCTTNQPIMGALVVVTTANGQPSKSTNSNGQAVFSHVRPGNVTHTITVSADGYMLTSASAYMDANSDKGMTVCLIAPGSLSTPIPEIPQIPTPEMPQIPPTEEEFFCNGQIKSYIDLDAYCAMQYGYGAVSSLKDSSDAYSWSCTNNGDFIDYINMDVACQSQDPNFPFSAVGDPYNPYSWFCSCNQPPTPTPRPTYTPRPTPTPEVKFLCVGFGRCDAVTFPEDQLDKYQKDLSLCLEGVQDTFAKVVPGSEPFVIAMKAMHIAAKCQNDGTCQFYSGLQMAWNDLVVNNVSKALFKTTAPGVIVNLFVSLAQNQETLNHCSAMGPFYMEMYRSLQMVSEEQNRLNAYAVHSPAVIMVDDQEGRQTGFYPYGGTANQIPDSAAFYTGETRVIFVPARNVSRIKVVGTGSGQISLDVIQADRQDIKDYSFAHIPVQEKTYLTLDTAATKLRVDGSDKFYSPNYFASSSAVTDATGGQPLLTTIQQAAISYPIATGLGILVLGVIIGVIIVPRRRTISQGRKTASK